MAEENVIIPMNKFIERSTISREGKSFSVPGLSVSEITKNSNVNNKKAQSNVKSKLVDIWIPGIIQLKNAYIASIAPTYSRQRTVMGFPIWGILEIQFSGLVPAIYQDNFENVPTFESNSALGLF
jgi:hypothetical protein